MSETAAERRERRRLERAERKRLADRARLIRRRDRLLTELRREQAETAEVQAELDEVLALLNPPPPVVAPDPVEPDPQEEDLADADEEEEVPEVNNENPSFVDPPPLLTATLGASTATGAAINFTLDTVLGASDRVLVQTTDDPNSFASADLDADMVLRDQLLQSGRPFAPADVSNDQVVIDWLEPGDSGIYAHIMSDQGGQQSNIVTVGPFNTTGATVREFNWNPGGYIGGETQWSGAKYPTKEQMAERINTRGYNSARWTGAGKATGVRLKFHWGEIERAPNEFFWGVIEAWLEWCETWNGRLLITFDYMASNSHLEQAGPSDLLESISSDPNNSRFPGTDDHTNWSGIAFYEWIRPTGKPRRLGRVWDPTAPTGARYRAMITAFLDRFGNNPLIEALGLKGEASLGTPTDRSLVGSDLGSSTNQVADLIISDAQLYNVQTHDGYLRQLARDILALGYPQWLQMPANGLGGNPGAEHRNFLMWLKVAFDNPGIGFRKPDSHTQIRGTPHLPTTDFDRHFVGYPQWTLDTVDGASSIPTPAEADLHGMLPYAWDWQNPGKNRYNIDVAGRQNHVRGAMLYDGIVQTWDVGNASADLTSPVPTTTATFNPVHGATHYVPIASNGLSWNDWADTLDAEGWVPAYTAMPQAWVDAGNVAVRTGVVP